MNEYRYILEKGSKKYHCPDCNKKTFVRYIDAQNGNNYLSSEYGRCDRESNCGYNKLPPKDESEKTESVIRQESERVVFEFTYSESLKNKVKELTGARWDKEAKRWFVNTINIDDEVKAFAKENGFRIIERKPEHTQVPIPVEVLMKTLKGYEQNIFIKNLLTDVLYPFNTTDVEKVIALYYLGTIANGYRKGAITFPFIDQNNRVRAIQIKTFDKDNHTLKTGFLHRMLETGYKRTNKPLPEWLQGYLKNDPYVSCLFGAHLLRSFKSNPVVLVESPKSAIIGTLYFGLPNNPSNLLWLGVYNLSSLKLYKCKVLKGRTVYLFPDLSKTGHAYENWSTKAKGLEQALPGTRFIVSDLLEQLALQSDKDKGNDLADYLIKLDWRKFRPKPMEGAKLALPKSVKGVKSVAPKKTFITPVQAPKPKQNPKTWDKEIMMLEAYFASAILPTQPVKLDQCSTITNVQRFVESHLATVREYNGNPTFEPHLDRLHKAKEIINQSAIDDLHFTKRLPP